MERTAKERIEHGDGPNRCQEVSENPREGSGAVECQVHRTSPALMSPRDRQREIAVILSLGYLRARKTRDAGVVTCNSQ